MLLSKHWVKAVSFVVVFFFVFTFFGGEWMKVQSPFGVRVVYAQESEESNLEQENILTEDDGEVQPSQTISPEESAEVDVPESDQTNTNPESESGEDAETEQTNVNPESGEDTNHALETTSQIMENSLSGFRNLASGLKVPEMSLDDFEKVLATLPEPEEIDPEAYTNIIDNPDGTHTAEFYFAPIKYKDESGEWKEIDHSLVKKTNRWFETAASPVKMQFAGSASEELATIEKDEYRVSFKPSSNAPAIQSQKHADNDNVYNNVSSIKTNAKVKLKTGSKEILASEYQKNQEYQAIKFEGIFNNKQDIVIQPSGDGVKEDIVLPSIPEQSEFSFEFTLENLYPVLLEDGNVWLLDRNTNEIAAAIPAPNMIDSSPEEHESYDIDVSMRKISDTKYLYTLIPNRDWLEEEGRVYPVRIDPSVTYTTSNMLDTFITSKYPNNNYANDANIKVGNSGDLGVSRGYFQLKNFPNAIGSGKVITSAKFTAWQNYNGASTVQIGLYPSIVDYNNSTITWSNRAWYADDPAATATVSSVKSYTWDVTSMIKNWYADSSQLRSFTMKNVDEGPNKYKRFGSAQYGTSSQRPKLVVNYTNPPSAPSSVTIKTTGWTKDKITVAWGTITQESSSTLSEVQYSTTSATSGFAKITNPSKLSGGSATLDLPEGKKYVWIRGKNARGQVGAATRSNVQYQRDRTAPNIPTSITGTPNFNGPIGSMTANWTATTDAGCGVDYYEVAIKKNDDPWDRSLFTKVNSNVLTFTYSGLSDQAKYQVAVRAYDKLGNYSGWKYSSFVTVGDYTPPTAPASVSIAPENWTNNTSPTVSWEGITDTKLQKAQYKIDDVAWVDIPTENGTSSGSYVINCADLADGSHTISIRGMDQGGTAGPEKSITYHKDTTAPLAEISAPEPEAVAGKLQINATITNEANLSTFSKWELKYGLGTAPAASNLITANTGTNLANGNLCGFDISELEDNQVYSIYLYCEDAAGNVGVSNRLEFLKTANSKNIPATLTIISPPAESNIAEPTMDITYNYVEESRREEEITDAKLIANGALAGTSEGEEKSISFDAAKWDAQKGEWTYPEGQPVFLYVQGKDGNGEEVYSHSTYKTLGLNKGFTNEEEFTDQSNIICTNGKVLLSQENGAYAGEGEFRCLATTFAGNVSYLDLITNEDCPAETDISYQISVNGGITWNEITPVSTDGGKTMTAGNREYFTLDGSGNQVILRVQMATENPAVTPALSEIKLDVCYTTYSTAVLIDNDFSENARGFTSLYQVRHDGENSRIILEDGKTSGTIYSTPRKMSGDVTEVALQVEENLPEGTSISYFVSANGGETFTKITPGDPNNAASWESLIVPGNAVVLKAVLLSEDGIALPELNSWQLSVKTMSSGQPYVVKLVDEPDHLSTLADANYQTLLRWKASDTEDVTYNIYRSETPYFIPSEETLAASGIEGASWSDYNLNYGKTFYYQVTAVKEINGHARESLPSNQAWATVVDRDEVQKRLGLQDYWSYAGFTTGSGDGYVNVSNGNLAYISTDMVISDPFFAMVMRRTYNSMATTKTPLGYGWDFSFNTCLLREWDDTGENEVGMILKDGDGSFHRFPFNKEDGTYESAAGTFMKLTKDEAADEYTITRKDNIVYHFDAQSMKLKSFTNPNGNALTFAYDERGNLASIENTVGEKIEITYNVIRQGPGANSMMSVQSSQDDYIYVNDHVDMVETVSWTQSGADDPASMVYHYVYSADDKLIKAYTTLEGNNEYAENFTYETNGKLNKITNPEGKEYRTSYDAAGRLSKIVDPIADTFTFTYSGNLTTVTDKYGTTNQYQFGEQEQSDLTIKKIDALGHSVNYTYNTNLQVTGISYLNTVNGAASPSTISYIYGYDDNGNLTSITGPNGSQTLYEGYNQWNKPTRMKVKKDSSTWLTTTYIYDNAGNLLTTTDPSGKTMSNTYGTQNGQSGYLLSTTDRFGKKTVYTYDTKGRVTEVNEKKADGTHIRRAAAYTYDAYGNTKTAKDALDNTTTYDYNDLGFLIKTTYADGTSTQQSYSLIGNQLVAKNARGNAVSYTYDDAGRLIGASYPDGRTNSIAYDKWDSDNDGTNDSDKVTKTDGEGRTTIEYYDKTGRLVKETVGGVTTRYEYDLIGNMVKVTDGAGRVTTAQYDALGNQTKITQVSGQSGVADISNSFTYDLLGNQLTVTDGQGFTTSYTYDSLNRLQKVTQIVDGQTYTTAYTYDIEEGGYIKNKVTDANGNEDETWFDIAGRKIKEYSPGTVSMTTTYAYNANNQVTMVTRNDGSKEKYEYNILGQTTRVNYYTSGADTSTDSGYYITYTYDDNGNVKTETVIQDGESYVTEYAYDAMDRVVQQTQGKGQIGALQIDYTYNKADQVTSLQYLKEDNQSGVAGGGSGMQTLGYVYDVYGRISQIKLGNAIVRDYKYTEDGDLSYVKDYRGFDSAGADGSYLQKSYMYNAFGVVEKITTTDHAGGSVKGVKKEEQSVTFDNNFNILTETTYTNYGTAKTVNKSYEYDAIGRLTKATEDDKVTTYTYDKVGNRLTQVTRGKTLTYVYNSLDQLLSIKEGTKTISTFSYDARGNQTKEETLAFTLAIGKEGMAGYESKDHKKVAVYTYDLKNQLIETTVTTPTAAEKPANIDDVTLETVTTINAYNAEGKRIERVEDNQTTRFYYTGDMLLYSTDEAQVLETENILDTSGSIIASKRFLDPSEVGSEKYANKYYFYNYDIRGSVTNILGPDGNVVKGYEYDEFGKTESKGSADFQNDVTFTSSIGDMSSGLQYMNARFYQPSTGRFLTQDSYSGNPYDPWTQHLYSYCGNNPTTMIDPTGHSMQSLLDEINELKRQRKIRITFRDNYAKNRWKYEKGSDMFNLLTGGWQRNKKIVKELDTQIREKEKIYNAFRDLQNKIDKKDYKSINQRQTGYENIPLFDDNNIADNGCGYIAAVIAASNLGADVDVHDAYLYFNKPENELFNTGSISPIAVSGYLMEQGYCPTSADYDMISNGTYITYYKWDDSTSENWHFECLTTDAQGAITSYNNPDGPHKTFDDYMSSNYVVFLPGLAYYQPY